MAPEGKSRGESWAADLHSAERRLYQLPMSLRCDGRQIPAV